MLRPMLNFLRTGAAALILCLPLCGCFVSDQALITPSTADYPVRGEAQFTRDVAPSTVKLVGGYYQMDDGTKFLLRAIGSSKYVAQKCSGEAKWDNCGYVLLVLKGRHVSEYDFDTACKGKWAAYRSAGLVTRPPDLGEPGLIGDCAVASFSSLATIFNDLYASGAQSDQEFDLTVK